MTYHQKLNACLAAIKQGDESKYRELQDLTYGPLMNVAKIYLFNKSYAESVVQDMLCSIYLYADHYDTSRDAYNYLWQIVKRKAFDCNKKHRNDKWINIDDLPICDIVDPYERANAKMDVERALQRLRDTDRLIIKWKFEEDLTQEEIGKRLGVSKSAVNQRLSKTMKKLSEYLK